MGTFNTVNTELRCPRCGQRSIGSVDLYFGDTSEMRRLSMGDHYPGLETEKGSDKRSLHGPGYTECSSCGFDFYCNAIVVGDLLEEVIPDHDHPPIRADREEDCVHACPACDSALTSLRRFGAMRVAVLVCAECDEIVDVRLNDDGTICRQGRFSQPSGPGK